MGLSKFVPNKKATLAATYVLIYGGAYRARTGDLYAASVALSQLS